MNRVCLIGRLTKNTELRATPNGTYTTSNTIAVNRNFKNANGEYDADFINIVAWRNTAEFLCKYAKKGSLVGCDGRIQTRTYEDTDGKKVYVTEVLVEQVDLLEKKQENRETNTETKQEPVNDPFADFGETVQLDDNFLD